VYILIFKLTWLFNLRSLDAFLIAGARQGTTQEQTVLTRQMDLTRQRTAGTGWERQVTRFTSTAQAKADATSRVELVSVFKDTTEKIVASWTQRAQARKQIL
jgi:hypothetical protein